MIFNHLLSLVFAGFWFKLLSTLASALILTEKFDFYNLDKNGIDFSETVANIGSVSSCSSLCSQSLVLTGCIVSAWDPDTKECKLGVVNFVTELMTGPDSITLTTLAPRECQSCLNNITLIESDPMYDSRFNASNVLSDGPCDLLEGSVSNYLVGKDNKANFSFIVEFANWGLISKVQLRNSRNHYHNDRGADQFSVALSDDNVSFTTVLTDNLPDARNKDCGPEIPLLEFIILKGARFVKFTIISFYGKGPVLQFINFLFI